MKNRMEDDRNKLWEYVLVAHPDENVCEKVTEEKRIFSETYKHNFANNIKPHIEIANFQASESMEETLIRWIQRICSLHSCFPVTLNNYSGLPPDTIYVRVQDQGPFKQLAMQLKVIDGYVRSNGYPEARFINRPHLSIAKGLTDDIYAQAMPEYSRKTFHEFFWVTELVMLKRSNQFEECRQVNVFRFYPPDTNMQGEVAQQLKHQPI